MDIADETAKAYRAFAAGRNAEAADCARRVLEKAPEDPAALTLIGRLALAAGEADVAYNVFKRILESHPQMAALWLDLALAARDLGRHQEASMAAEHASVLNDRDPAAWTRLGEIRLSLNQRERAAEAFRRTLTLDSANVAAHLGLCQAAEVGSDIIDRMGLLIRSPSLRPTEVAALHYALARLHRHTGRREQFLHHLFAANATQRSICPDGRDRYEAIFDRLESTFTSDAIARAERADAVEPMPIFILGMPRSGTTLVEQLLAGHPGVTSGGELDHVRRSLRRAFERHTDRPFPEGFDTVPAAGLSAMARDFARRLAIVGKGSPYVTDKTPGNYHVLGLLRVLFPRGHIVHVARDPMDTCFSILQYQFDDRSPHTCDVELLAYAYARYLRLMHRWRELFRDEFITVQYERLVASPEAEARRVFEHCDLEWNSSYLDFHRAANAVRTFSASQVRQPIYGSSVGAWREFAVELAPLRRALHIELEKCGVFGDSGLVAGG